MSTDAAPESVLQAPAPELAAPVAPEAAPAAPGRAIAGAAVMSDDPRLGLDPAAVLALSASAGNATVARALAPLAAPAVQVQRQDTPPAADKHALNPADKARAENAKRLVDKAKANKDTALKALEGYSAAAPGHLEALKANADKNLEMYKAACEHVNYIIGEAKEIAKIQTEVLMQIVGSALGGIGNVIEPIAERASQIYNGMKTAWGELNEFGLGALIDKGGVAAGTKGAMGMGTGEVSGPTAGDPAAQELAFYQSFAKLHGNSTQLLGVAVQVAKVSEPIGKVGEALAGIANSGQTRSDYPLEKLDKEAATLENATRALAAKGPEIDKMLADLTATVTQAKAAAPKDQMEVEKALWKSWAAGISPKDTDLLDLDVIEKYLKRIGIWDQLGIDIGGWFSDVEEAMAVSSAAAQQMVLQHKGEAVEYTKGSPVTLDGLPGAPKLPASLDPSSKVVGDKVRAVVVDARAVGKIDTDVFEKTGKTKATVAEYLLTHGFIQVILRGYESLDGDKAATPGGPAPAPAP